MKERTDEELVRECLEGSQDAWISLVRRYRQLIHSVIRSYHLPDSDAGDVFQAVCLELFNSLPRLREVKALRRWLITVSGHQCLRWKRTERLPEADVLDVEDLPDNESSEGVVMLERQQMLREAMAELPLRCREMIELLFLQDPPLPYAELASRMRLAVGSIGFIRKRCLDKLKTALERRGF